MQTEYHWVITADLNTDPEHDTDLSRSFNSVSCRKLTAGEIWTHAQGQEFRLVDADFTVLFEGIYVGPDECREQPLNEFGVHQDGCCDIQYRNEQGNWEVI